MVHARSHLAGSAFVAFGFAVAMMGTTLPTPLYPLYNRAFDLFCGIVGLCVLGVLYTLRRRST